MRTNLDRLIVSSLRLTVRVRYEYSTYSKSLSLVLVLCVTNFSTTVITYIFFYPQVYKSLFYFSLQFFSSLIFAPEHAIRVSTCFVRSVWICGGGERVPFPAFFSFFFFFQTRNRAGGGGGPERSGGAAERSRSMEAYFSKTRANTVASGAGTSDPAQISDEEHAAPGPGGHCRLSGRRQRSGDAAHARGGAYGRRGQWR